jgi:hypothetical protein
MINWDVPNLTVIAVYLNADVVLKKKTNLDGEKKKIFILFEHCVRSRKT